MYEQTLCNLPYFKLSGWEDQRFLHGSGGGDGGLYLNYLAKNAKPVD